VPRVELDPTDLSLDAATRERADKAAELARQTLIGDLKWVVSNKRGRRFVHRLLEQAGVYRSSFTPGDPHATSFNEGQRNLGNWVLEPLAGHAPESYASMLSENRHARHSD
jgi:hypothetical protein